MKKNILFAAVILLVVSCTNSSKNEVVITEQLPVTKILTLEFASKNPNIEQEGTHVPSAEMLHFTLKNNEQAEFVGVALTLNNLKENAVNFTLRNDSVFCVSPVSLFVMSMPPKPGKPPVMISENAEFHISPMSLLKFESVNIMFVGLGK